METKKRTFNLWKGDVIISFNNREGSTSELIRSSWRNVPRWGQKSQKYKIWVIDKVAAFVIKAGPSFGRNLGFPRVAPAEL